MVRLSLLRDDVNSTEAIAYALQRVFGWTAEIATDFAQRAHADGSAQLDVYADAGEAEDIAARLLVFGMLPRLTVVDDGT